MSVINFHLKHLKDILKNVKNFERAAKVADAYMNFPYPALEQHLSSDKKARRYLGAIGKSVLAGAFAAINISMLWVAYLKFGFPMKHPVSLVLFILAMFCAGAAAGDYEKAWSIYWKFRRRESQGAAHWAVPADLEARNMLFPREAKVTPTHLPLAYLGTKYQIAIPVVESREHMAFFGQPGCGKSDGFFIWQARAYADIGASIILDTKGECYKYSAHYYDNVYRLDFERPEYSDRIDLLSFCRANPNHPGEDAKLSGEISSFMIGFDPNNPKGGENPFWPQSATSMLKCFLLFLAERFEHVQPADIFKVLAVLTKQAEAEAKRNPKNPPPHPLHRAFMNANNPEISAEWSPLSTLDEKTLGNIVISMTTPIASFRDPAVQTILSVPSNEERARGCRVVDFRDLRRKGTAIYVVVPEGQASRLASVLGTIFGVAMNVLRRTGGSKGACDTLIQLDEAGNVPLRNLREDIGVGRGRRMTFSLGYQSKSQPITQYGADYAKAFLASTSIKVALPGNTDETAEWFSKMLDKTTTNKKTINDARADALDSERWDEVGVDLMAQGAFRTLERYKQCVLVINQAPPVLARIPEAASIADPRESIPQKFVWSAEDLRKAQQDELAASKFFSSARALPRLPRSAYDTAHSIEVAPTQTFDIKADDWTLADVMKAKRREEILAYASRLQEEMPTGEIILEERTRLNELTRIFAQAPEEIEEVDAAFVAAVRPDTPGVKNQSASGNSDGESNTATSSRAATHTNAGNSNAGGNGNTGGAASALRRSTTAPMPVVEREVSTERVKPQPQQPTGPAPTGPTSRLFKRITPERVEDIVSSNKVAEQAQIEAANEIVDDVGVSEEEIPMDGGQTIPA